MHRHDSGRPRGEHKFNKYNHGKWLLFFYWPYLLLCNRLYMQTLIMMSLVFSFSLRYTIQFRTDDRGKALSSAVCQSLFFTTLVAELYLTVSPKAGGGKKKSIGQGWLLAGENQCIHETGGCFPRGLLLFHFTLNAARRSFFVNGFSLIAALEIIIS